MCECVCLCECVCVSVCVVFPPLLVPRTISGPTRLSLSKHLLNGRALQAPILQAEETGRKWEKNQETLIPETYMFELNLTPGSQRQLHRAGTPGPARRRARFQPTGDVSRFQPTGDVSRLQPTGAAPRFQPRAQGRQEQGLGAKDTRAKAGGRCRAGAEARRYQRGLTAGPASRVV